MEAIERWIISRIVQTSPTFSDLEELDQVNENFFASGRLDSLEIMDLLLDLENAFGFTFNPESFQDRRIQTVLGLGIVVREIIYNDRSR